MGGTNRLGTRSMLAAAALFAVGVLVLMAVAEPAGAAFPGTNGKVAFAKFNPRSEEGQILAVNPDGTEQINLGPGFSPSYSPSGDQVVFERFTGDGERDFNQDIFVMSADGTGDPTQVTTGKAYEFSPTFLNETTVAFVRESRRNGVDIFVKVIGATTAENITDTPGIYEESVASSPDGTRIAFSRYNRSSDIFIMDVAGVTPPENLTRSGKIDESQPDWSPDGDRIVFSSLRYPKFVEGREPRENAEISVIDVDGTNREDLTDGPPLDLAPVFSPNGSRIAFSKVAFSRAEGETADIFLMRADGTGVRQLTDTRAFEFGPSWQPAP
jgi:TolB protein